MSALAQKGSVGVSEGVTTFAVSNLGLPFTPTGVSVSLQKPGINSENITAVVYGSPTTDGFSVEFSSEIPTAGYVLNFEIYCATSDVDDLSSLAVTYRDLVAIVSRFLGYTGTLDESQSSAVDAIINSGIRQFYFPPAVQGVETGYEWSFMRPKATITTVADTRIYDLPVSFGRLNGGLFFESDKGYQKIVLISESQINTLIQNNGGSGVPRYASIRYKTTFGQHGQLQEITFYPVPDAAYTLNYVYSAYTGRLSSVNTFPLGGARYSEVITESCLSIAEQRENDEIGIHTDRFRYLLAAAIAEDKKDGAVFFGQMGSGDWSSGSCGGCRERNGNVTYKGVTW